MSVQDEIFRIRYQAEGQAAIAKARAELERLEQITSRAAQKFRDGSISSQQFAKATEVLGARVASARQQLDGFQQASRGGGGSRNIGLAAIEASRALEDLNFGLVGAINNIPQLVMALGGPAGLTAVIGVLGAAALYLSRNWGGVLDALGVGVPQPALAGIEAIKKELESVNGEMDKLREKTRLTAAEFIKLGQLQGKQQSLRAEADRDAAIGGVFEGKNERQSRVAKGFAEGIREAGLTGDAGRSRFGGILSGAIGAAGGNRLGETGTDTEQARKLVELAAEGSQAARDEVLRLLSDFGGEAGREIANAITLRSEDLYRPLDPSQEVGPTRQDMESLQADQEARERAEQERVAIRDEEAALVEQDDAENLAEFRRKRAENQQKADEIASALLGGNLGESIYAGRATEEDVAAAMRAAGFDEGTVGRRSGQVLESATAMADEDIRRRALEGGMTEDQARLMLRAESLGVRMSAPTTTDAASFAQQVQAGGAKDPAELMKAANEKADRQIKLLDEINRELRQGGRLGA